MAAIKEEWQGAISTEQVIMLRRVDEGCRCPSAMAFSCALCRYIQATPHAEFAVLMDAGLISINYWTRYALTPEGRSVLRLMTEDDDA